MAQARHNVGAMTRRILKAYDSASAAHKADGTAWYGAARTFCADLAASTPYTFAQVAHVVAALSPQCSWQHNCRATLAAVALHLADPDTLRAGQLAGYPGYSVNVRKAAAILDGDLSALRGPKVEAFAAAIMGDLSHVVVDVWATRAARSLQANTARAYADDELPGAPERRAIAEAYRRAAGHRGIAPAEMQAVVWVATRESAAWARPQQMTDSYARRFWQRQARARRALGLAVLPYNWNGHSARKLAAIAAA